MDQFVDLTRWPGPVREGRRVVIDSYTLRTTEEFELDEILRLKLKLEPGEVVRHFEVMDPWQHVWEVPDTW